MKLSYSSRSSQQAQLARGEMCAAMAGNAKVINNERQRDVKMRGWIARVYCCCCYTHSSGRIAKRNTDGRTDGQTDREQQQQQFYSTLQESCCCCFWSQRGRCTLCLSLFSMLYSMLCTTLLDRLLSSHHWQHTDICARNCEQRPSTQRRKSLMSFLNSFTGFWLTHTYSAYCLMAQLCRLDRSCLKN